LFAAQLEVPSRHLGDALLQPVDLAQTLLLFALQRPQCLAGGLELGARFHRGDRASGQQEAEHPPKRL
jgi:hypothetical protein